MKLKINNFNYLITFSIGHQQNPSRNDSGFFIAFMKLTKNKTGFILFEKKGSYVIINMQINSIIFT